MILRKLFVIAAMLPVVVWAQAIKVTKEDARIEGRNTPGFQVILPGTTDEVTTYLTKYFKAMGKTRANGDYITVTDATIGSRQFMQPIYATARQSGTAVAAWVGVPQGNGEEQPASNPELRQLAHDFGVYFHREKIQVQVDEALRALQAVEKQQLRLTNQQRDLGNRIENNKREKSNLEKAIADNKLESEELTRKIADNARARDSVAVATEQIRKVLNMHQERQKNVR